MAQIKGSQIKYATGTATNHTVTSLNATGFSKIYMAYSQQGQITSITDTSVYDGKELIICTDNISSAFLPSIVHNSPTIHLRDAREVFFQRSFQLGLRYDTTFGGWVEQWRSSKARLPSYFYRGEVLTTDTNQVEIAQASGYFTQTQWVTGTLYSAYTIVYLGDNCYYNLFSGTSGGSAPTHTTGFVSDGTILWAYLGNRAGFSTLDIFSLPIKFEVSTTNATPTVLSPLLPNISSMPVDTNKAFSARVEVIGRSGGDYCYFILDALIINVSDVTSLATPALKTRVAATNGALTWDATLVANDTTDSLNIQVTGQTATNIDWIARVIRAQSQ